MSGIEYRPEIDGLRAVAVIPVLLFHLGFSWLPGGYIGVDVFFVISGFLITSIIKRELDQGSFTFRDFWARRVKRILPAMIFVSAVTLTVTYLCVHLPDQQVIGSQALAALMSVANVYFWLRTGDYWGTASEESPFLHAWSLAVEEQFYLFFPLAMWVIFRYRAKWLQGSILAAAFASLILFLWGLEVQPIATFYLLPARVWELATGCLLAVVLSDQSAKPRKYEILATAGLGMIVTTYVFIAKPSGSLGLAVLGTALIIAFGRHGFCNRLLSLRPVVHIGKLSYSLYLWHWPLFVLAEPLGLSWPGSTDKIVLVVLTYLLALTTYFLVEKSTRRREGLVPVILASGGVVVAGALWMAWTPRYYDTAAFEQPTWNHYIFNLDPRETAATVQNTVGRGVNIPPGSHALTAYKEQGIIEGPAGSTPKMVVLGDSHGLMWSETLRKIAREEGVTTAFFSMGGISPFLSIPPLTSQSSERLTAEEKLEFDRARLRCISDWKPKVVVISCYWDTIESGETTELLKFLETYSGKVLLLEDPPVLNMGDNQNAMQVAYFKGLLPVAGQKQYLDSVDGDGQAVLNSLPKRHHNVSVVRVRDLYQSESGALLMDGKRIVYIDNDHLTEFGASLAIPRLRPAIRKALGIDVPGEGNVELGSSQ